jgi:hypothetical protein
LLNTVRAHLRHAGSRYDCRRGDSGVVTCRWGDTRQLAPGYTWTWRCVLLSVCLYVCVCTWVRVYDAVSWVRMKTRVYVRERESARAREIERETFIDNQQMTEGR